MKPAPEAGWLTRYGRPLAAPVVLWCLVVGILAYTLLSRRPGPKEYDQAALREWVEESRSFRETLPEMVRRYLQLADPNSGRPDLLPLLAEQIRDHLRSLCDPTKMYPNQLPLFPVVYRLEVRFATEPPLEPVVWESGVPRPRGSQVGRLEYPLLADSDPRAVLRLDYQLHAFNRRQRDEQAANVRQRWVNGVVSLLAVAATAVAFLWIALVQVHERDRQRQRALAQQQMERAERLLLEEELRRREAERRHDEVERQLLTQRLETEAAQRQALELKSQLYASIGIMAGSYAHNIKNLLVRPNDLLRRCLEADGLSPAQDFMLREVRQTLGTVTDRLQQILQTVRRDPSKSEPVRLDLNRLVEGVYRTWEDLAREKWKLNVVLELVPGALWVDGDLSHLQQAVENLLFNSRDATFEMRAHLREQARQAIHLQEGRKVQVSAGPDDSPGGGPTAPTADLRQALIAAAAWRGRVVLRTRTDGGRAVLEVIDNGIGMTAEVSRRCTETHFSTKRDNAAYEGNSTGMGLGLSFVVTVLEHHRARLEVESEPLGGASFRVLFPPAT